MTSKEYEHLLASKVSEFRLNNKSKLIKTSKFANQIGSTQLEDIPYGKQLEIKKEALLSLFKNIVQEDILSDFDIISSPKIIEYRFKAEFVASFNPKFEPINRLGQRKKGNFNWVIDLDEYILIDKEIFNKVRRVYDYSLSLGLNSYDLKKQIGDLRYLTVKHYQDQSMLIITSYNKDKRFNEVIDFAIKQGFNSVYWLVNNTLHDSFEGEIIKFEGQEYLKINIHFNNKIFMFLTGPFTFFQNNIFGFQKLFEYIDSTLIKFNTAQLNLYDLYCGVGVLGISLANKFKSVKGIEIVQDSIDLAIQNQKLNKINNADFKCFDVKNLVLQKDTDSVTIVDPPRTGLEDKGVSNVLDIGSKYVVYVSCNPITLAYDIQKLSNQYKIIDLKAFDMFPQTYHTECLCILERY